MITQAELKAAVVYDPETGLFTWARNVPRHAKAGDPAGGRRLRYWRISIGNKLYSGHQLAWLYMTGVWPDQMIDHRDGDGCNNRWRNLRAATPAQNTMNCRGHRDGLKGVTLLRSGKYQAGIKLRGKSIYLGVFDTEGEAHAVYVAKAVELFGEYARAA